MATFLIRRLGASLLVLLAATYFMYMLTANSGDPLEDLRTSTARNKDELIARRIELLNLDVPPYLRYFLWLGGVLKVFIGQPDLGKNLSGQEVTDLLGSAIGVTLQLVTIATFTAILLGVITGISTALRQYSVFDYTVTFISFLFFSLPVFWVAVLLKQYLAIGFNDFLADPSIPIPVVIGLTLAAALIWQGIIGGNRKRRLLIAGIAGGITLVTLVLLNLTNWFAEPQIGPIVGGLLGAALALFVTLVSTGLSNKRARNASLVTVAIGLVMWYPFKLWISGEVTFWLYVVLAVVTVLVGYFVGWFMGGEDRGPVARTAAISAFLMGGILALDRFMQAWPVYNASAYINNRPFATVGAVTPNLKGNFWITGVDSFTHLLLPTLALLLVGFAGYTRYSRASLLEVMNQDFIRTARAKGLTERTVIMRHAFRNAMIPLTTLVAFDFAGIIGGAVITERVFGWSGMGSLFVSSLARVDVNPVMGFFLITGTVAVVFNLVADLVYTLLDPRIRVNN
jgi:peptide/nickel transport system permease protein